MGKPLKFAQTSEGPQQAPPKNFLKKREPLNSGPASKNKGIRALETGEGAHQKTKGGPNSGEPETAYSYTQIAESGKGNAGVPYLKSLPAAYLERFVLDAARLGPVNRTELRVFLPDYICREVLRGKDNAIHAELQGIFKENWEKRNAVLQKAAEGAQGEAYLRLHELRGGTKERGKWREILSDHWDAVVGYSKWLIKTLNLTSIPHFNAVANPLLLKMARGKERAKLMLDAGLSSPGGPQPSAALPFAEMDKARGQNASRFWYATYRFFPERIPEYVNWVLGRMNEEGILRPSVTEVTVVLPSPVVAIIRDSIGWEAFGLKKMQGGRKERMPSPPPIAYFRLKPYAQCDGGEKKKHAARMLLAASRQDITAVVNYLDAGFPLTLSNNLGGTALHIFAGHGKPEHVETLLTHAQVPKKTAGAMRKKILEARDKNGNTPLICAASSGSPETVSIFAREGAKLDAREEGGKTALIVAALSEDNPLKVAEALLKAGANPTLKDNGITLEEYNAELEKDEKPLSAKDCAKRGGIHYVDPPRSAAEYARQLKLASVAKILESAERDWKKAHPVKKAHR